MIEIRSFFTDWHAVSPAEAQQYARYLRKTVPERCHRLHLRGATVKELLGM